jgi:hypothetical protein
MRNPTTADFQTKPKKFFLSDWTLAASGPGLSNDINPNIATKD